MAVRDEVFVDIITKTQTSIASLARYAAAITAAVLAVRKLVSIVDDLNDAYFEAERAEVKLNAALRATGYAVGITATEMDNMATQLSKLTAIDDEAIKGAEGLLVTFTQIGKQVFPDALDAAADMSVMFGQDLQQSVIQLGTALNDPIQGIGRLRRIGISFTEDQKNLIQTLVDSNDVMGAQRVILDELNREFGGVAKAMGDTAEGAAKNLKIAMGNLKEQLGQSIQEGWKPVNIAITEFIDKITIAIERKRQFDQVVTGGLRNLSEAFDTRGQLEIAAKNLEMAEGALAKINENIAKAEAHPVWERIKAMVGDIPTEGMTPREWIDAQKEIRKQIVLRVTEEERNVKSLQYLISMQDKATASTGEMDEETKKVIETWKSLNNAMVTINALESVLGNAYDEEAAKTTAVRAALESLAELGYGPTTRNVQKLIELYGQYIPKLDAATKGIGRHKEAIDNLNRSLEILIDAEAEQYSITLLAFNQSTLAKFFADAANMVRDYTKALNAATDEMGQTAWVEFGDAIYNVVSGMTAAEDGLSSYFATMLSNIDKMLFDAGWRLIISGVPGSLELGAGMILASGLINIGKALGGLGATGGTGLLTGNSSYGRDPTGNDFNQTIIVEGNVLYDDILDARQSANTRRSGSGR